MIQNLNIKNINCLTERIKLVDNFSDFEKVFKVFREEPFYENWTKEEMQEEYNEIKSNGEILGYYANNDIAGILTLISGAKESHPVKFTNPDEVIYISDIAVRKQYRGQGFAKELVNYFMNFVNNQEYYKEAYLRTNLQGSMSERLFIPKGFCDMIDENNKIITQMCSFPRTLDNLPEEDERKFLSKKL